MPAREKKQPKRKKITISGSNLTRAQRQAELERVNEISGFRCGEHDFLAEVDVNTLKKRNDLWESRHRNVPKERRKLIELIRVAAYTALRNPPAMIQLHIHAAHQAGATPEEIYWVIDSMHSVAGGAARMTGLEAWRMMFRPDIPSILRVVKLTDISSKE
jgi:alkylhydroperoxidase/carboxymuconolactone decarboxylase family protein YurZ